MKDFKKFDGGFNRRDGGRPSFGGKPGFKKFDRSNDRPPMMHKATCTDCGKGCEVPFRPSGDKPVLCSNCLAISVVVTNLKVVKDVLTLDVMLLFLTTHLVLKSQNLDQIVESMISKCKSTHYTKNSIVYWKL